MVDALRAIHKLLKPNGTLIDIHSTSELIAVQVWSGDEKTTVGWMKDETDLVDYRYADKALAEAVTSVDPAVAVTVATFVKLAKTGSLVQP